MATVIDRLGGRVIELLIPFETQGRKIEFIRLKPITFDHTLRWQRGAFSSSLVLLMALSGENESTLRMIRYPDVDRVLDAMMDMLPETIRNDISSGVIPKPAEPPPAALDAFTNGGAPREPEAEPTPEEPFAGIDK